MYVAEAVQLAFRRLPAGEPDGGTVLLAVAAGILGLAFVGGCLVYGPAFESRSDGLWRWARSAVVVGLIVGSGVAVVGLVMHFS